MTYDVTCRVPVSGIVRMTTIDFPDQLAAVFFTSGCPWKCRYCHNPELQTAHGGTVIPPGEVDMFLESRRDYLDGIVLSGGEPTIHQELPDFLRHIRSYGYKTALHTNGVNPDMLKHVLEHGLVEYVAMDVKAPPRHYDIITGVTGSSFPVSRSISIVVSSRVPYEFRTTWHPLLLSTEQLVRTMRALAHAGSQRYYLQTFRRDGVEDRELTEQPDISIPNEAIEIGTMLFPDFGVR